MFLYEEYNDADAFGERDTMGFEAKIDAEQHLIERVEAHFGQDFEDIELNEDDTIREDYVSYNDGNGTRFWTITPLPVVPALWFRQKISISRAKEIADAYAKFWDNVDPFSGLTEYERNMGWQSTFADLLFGGTDTIKQLNVAIEAYDGDDETVAAAKELINLIQKGENK